MPRKARGTFTKVPDLRRSAKRRSAPSHCEGKGNDGGSHADQIMGTMNHACRDALFEN